MVRMIKTNFNSLPSLITAITVGVFVSWLAAHAVATLPGGVSPPPPLAGVTASPSSGPAPLIGVDVTASSGGVSGDKFVYQFNCNHGDGSIDLTYPSSGSTATNPYTATDLCSYSTAGTYTVLADITRYHTSGGSQSVSESAYTTTVTVNAPPPPPPSGGTPPPPPPAAPTWKNPCANPPGCNVPPPLDTSDVSQTKSGSVTALNALTTEKILTAKGGVVSGSGAAPANPGWMSVGDPAVFESGVSLNTLGESVYALLIPSGGVYIGSAAPPLSPAAGLNIATDVRIWGGIQQRDLGTFYTATTDGIVLATVYADDSGDRCHIDGISSGVGIGGASADHTYASVNNLFFPVYKGSLWRVTLTNVAGTCTATSLFYPFGKGTSN